MSEIATKKVLMNSIIYTCSGLLQKCFSFFLLPLYTAYLSTEDYGINSVASSFITSMSFVVAFSLFSAIMRFYVDLKDDDTKLKRFYGSISLFVLISGCIFAVILTIARELLSKYVFSGVDYYPIILISLISLIFNCQHTIYDRILRSQQKALKASIASIIYFLTTICLNIFFVVMMRMGATGTLLAGVISCFLYSAYFAVEMSVKGTISFCLDFPLLKDALKYSIPIMPHNLSTQIALLVSKVLIGGNESLASLGIYSVAAQFGNLADTIQNYVDAAYGPWLYENLKQKDSRYKETIRATVKLIIAVIGLLFIGIALFAQDYILLLVEESYAYAWYYVPLIVIVFAIKTIYYFYVEVMFYYKAASRRLFVATLSSSVTNVLLSAALIPVYGVVGSIAADAMAMLIRVIIVVVISRQYDDVGLRVRDFVGNFIIVVLCIFAGLAPSYINRIGAFSIGNFAYKVVVIFGYCLILVYRNKGLLRGIGKRFSGKKYREAAQ